jgi:uncharacterized protein YaaW (UPF0174 family)
MRKTISENPVDFKTLQIFLTRHALVKELKELAKILQCPEIKNKEIFAQRIVEKFYKHYHTPIGYRIKKATLDKMCDRIAKKLKLRALSGTGWKKLHSLSINIFEYLLKIMTPEEKRKLLDELWAKMTPEDKERIKKECNMADVSKFMESSGHLVAHVVGIHLARETALLAAAAIIRVNLGTELTLAASTILTRTATVFLGPLGWALMVFSINDFMGTNFKRVVPALLIINVVNVRVHIMQNKEYFNEFTSPKINPYTSEHSLQMA